jgi:crotonobetainyl-CoA:carnitine CoA-transferase CaiB-like acyl-CoA transferase
MQAEPRKQKNGPLHGVTVIEMSMWVAGPATVAVPTEGYAIG